MCLCLYGVLICVINCFHFLMNVCSPLMSINEKCTVSQSESVSGSLADVYLASKDPGDGADNTGLACL